MPYDNTNSGCLFPNEKQESPDDPQSTGPVNVDGRDGYLDCWKVFQGDDPQLDFRWRYKNSAQMSDGSGVLKLTDKKTDKYPDWRGDAKAENGDTFEVVAWRRVAKKSQKPFLALKFTKKGATQQQGGGAVDDGEPF